MTDTEILADRAARYRQQILDVATGPGAMIIAFPLFDTRRPLQEGEVHPWFEQLAIADAWGRYTPQPTVAEWLYGENTLWATGWLLWSQILRYRATQDAEALATARKAFHDLSYQFRLCRDLEPGLLGKPHGGRPGPTTSYDQSACPVLFYTIFARDLGTPDERAEAADHMARHGDYYLRRNWVMNHHGNLQRIVDPAHTSTMKYLACVHAAYDLTGDTRFRDAAFKYLRQIIHSGKLPWPTNPYEVNHNLYYWGLLCDYWSRTEIAAEFDFIGCIRAYWRAAQTAAAADMTRFGHYDTVTETFTPYPEQWLTQEDKALWPAAAPRQVKRRWVSPTNLHNHAIVSASVAALALLVRAHGLDDTAADPARRTLLRMDDDTLRWWFDDGRLPTELKPLLNIFSPETAAMWLVAYWQGRLHNVW